MHTEVDALRGAAAPRQRLIHCFIVVGVSEIRTVDLRLAGAGSVRPQGFPGVRHSPPGAARRSRRSGQRIGAAGTPEMTVAAGGADSGDRVTLYRGRNAGRGPYPRHDGAGRRHGRRIPPHGPRRPSPMRRPSVAGSCCNTGRWSDQTTISTRPASPSTRLLPVPTPCSFRPPGRRRCRWQRLRRGDR